MKIDEMKEVWNKMNETIEANHSFSRFVFVRDESRRAGTSLRPLFWGQICQIVFGVILILLAVGHWTTYADDSIQLVCGIVIHVYGVMVVILAGLTLAGIQQIDFASPVLEIQKRLASLRQTYIINGMIVGLPWWLLWIPFMNILLGPIGGKMFAGSPGWLIGSLAFGVVGLIATFAYHRWSVSRGSSVWTSDQAAGGSLSKAKQIMDEVESFVSPESDSKE